MFEDSLLESRVAHLSAAKRWTMVGSTALQAAAAALLVAMPLLHPERLTFHVDTPLVFTPPPPRPPLPVSQAEPTSTQAAVSTALPAARPLVPILIHTSGTSAEKPPIISPVATSMGPDTGVPDALRSGDGHGVKVSVTPTQPPASPRHVSQGVLAGMLLSPIRPVYPAIAKAAGISGTVVVEAVISKTGSIESLHVVSGPELLRAAALDAIRAARYQPFRLNGEPTEVQTTITVNFHLGG